MASLITSTSNGDWRLKCKNVTEKWAMARKNGLFTDVVFSVGSSEFSKSFHAHRNILAIGSPVFEAMFYGTLPEWKDPIIIPDIDPEAFDILLSYLYGEAVLFQTTFSAFEASAAADKYLVPQLKVEAENFIFQAGIHTDSVWQILQKAILLSMTSVIMKYLSHVAWNADTLLRSNSFLTVSEEVVQTVLEMRELNIREIHLFQAVIRWGQANGGISVPLKTKISSFLAFIRFKALTVEEFCSFTERHPGIITHCDALAILKHLHDPSTYQLPHWCSTQGNRLRPRSFKIIKNSSRAGHRNPFTDFDPFNLYSQQ